MKTEAFDSILRLLNAISHPWKWNIMVLAATIAACQTIVVAQQSFSFEKDPELIRQRENEFKSSPEYQAAIKRQWELIQQLLGSHVAPGSDSKESPHPDDAQTFVIPKSDQQEPAKPSKRQHNVMPFLTNIARSDNALPTKLELRSKWIKDGETLRAQLSAAIEPGEPPTVTIHQDSAQLDDFLKSDGPWKVLKAEEVTFPLRELGEFYDALVKYEEWITISEREKIQNAQKPLFKSENIQMIFDVYDGGSETRYNCGIKGANAATGRYDLVVTRRVREDLTQLIEHIPDQYQAAIKTRKASDAKEKQRAEDQRKADALLN